MEDYESLVNIFRALWKTIYGSQSVVGWSVDRRAGADYALYVTCLTSVPRLLRSSS